jgi:hypothetical protein
MNYLIKIYFIIQIKNYSIKDKYDVSTFTKEEEEEISINTKLIFILKKKKKSIEN